MEKRVLIAFVLSAVIFAVWSVLFPPPKQQRDRGLSGPTEEQERPLEVEVDEDEPIELESVVQDEHLGEVIGAESEEVIRFDNDVMVIELSNRGAAVRSMLLNGFAGDDGGPLEMIQTIDIPERTLPLQLVFDGKVDDRLYQVEQDGETVYFKWADGLGQSIEKKLVFNESGYGLEIEVTVSSALRGGELSVGTGMRDTGPVERQNRFSTWGDVVIDADGETQDIRREKLEAVEAYRPRQLNFAGFSDTYFLSLYLNETPVDEVVVEALKFEETGEDGEVEELPVLQIRLGSEEGRWKGRLFAAPKEFTLLQSQGGGLEKNLDFGFFHPISVFFLKALRWIHGRVGNWGWSIVLLTLGIRIVLFPLMHTSTVSMRRMQKMQPKVKAIQEKYKKNKSDPQVRAKMNQETMALYKTEGVNPMGGCLPILVQLPILWALYTLFAHAIELRHAPFMMWIVDLSAKDPLYITPVLMTGTMWLQQRLAPQAGDPQQQKIFRMMPLIFGIMFLGFPAGLVLYWLSNNVITIFQQELTLRLIGERGSSRKSGNTGKGKKK